MLKNLASMSGLNLFKAGVQFGVSTLVAFFVLPAEYGLIAFSLPIIQLISLITDMGLASAIIRQPALDRTQSGGALTFSVMIGLGAAVLMAALAYPIEKQSGLPGLGPVLIALSAAVFFSILAGVPRAILERALSYQRIAAIEGTGVILAAGLCTLAVALDAGIWAIVVFHVVLQIFRAVSFLIAARGRFALNRRWANIAPLLGFGGWVLATNLTAFFTRSLQNILIGVSLGAAAVGLYGLSYQFMILPLMAIAWPASGVLLATLSRVAENGERRFAEPVLGITLITALLVFPLMGWMTFGLAFPIDALMHPRWSSVGALLTILAPLGAIQSLAAYNGAVLLARGHTRFQFNLNVLCAAALVIGFLVALPYGLTAFAIVYLIVGTLTAFLMIAAKLWAAQIRPVEYLKTLLVPLAATLAGLSAAWAIGLTPRDWNDWALVSAAYGSSAIVVYALSYRTIRRALDTLGAIHGTIERAPEAVA